MTVTISLPRFVNVFVGEANVGDGNRFQAGSGFSIVCRLYLTPFLRSVIFIGKTALGEMRAISYSNGHRHR
jgi:hypothetical protein